MKLLIATSGTGGHIFPGIAVAEEWRARNHSFDILFVGTKEGMEKDVIPSEGFKLHCMSAGKIKGKSLFHKFRSILRLPENLKEAHALIKEYKPDFVLGMGGYASFVITVVAKLLGKIVCIQEQNSMPGLTNRLVGRIATRVFISFPKAASYFKKGKIVVCGNPLRRKVIRLIGQNISDSKEFRIFITGGSQGAQGINRMLIEALPLMSWAKDTCTFIHQAGKHGFETVQNAYKEHGFKATVFTFTNSIGEEYQKASLIISRSGSGIFEMAAHGKCAILIPFPHAADNHQYENARYFVDEGAAELLSESKDASKELARLIRFYFEHPEARREKEKKSKALARLDGAQVVVDTLISLAPKKEVYI